MKPKFMGRDMKQPIDYQKRIKKHLEAVKAGFVPDKLLEDTLKCDNCDGTVIISGMNLMYPPDNPDGTYDCLRCNMKGYLK